MGKYKFLMVTKISQFCQQLLSRVYYFLRLFYVRSIEHQDKHPIRLISISETLGDIAICYKTQWNANDETPGHSSELKVYTINGRSVGCVLSRRTITALCYSNAPEGASVNVIATGLNNGVIR